MRLFCCGCNEDVNARLTTDKMRRGELYRSISDELGYQYHTGELRTIEEARKVWKIVNKIAKSLS